MPRVVITHAADAAGALFLSDGKQILANHEAHKDNYGQKRPEMTQMSLF